MIYPQHGCGAVTAGKELARPDNTRNDALVSGCGKPRTVKGDAPGFVAQDPSAHVAHGLILDVPAQDTVIGGAHEFGQQQDLQFETHAKDSAAGAEGAKAPVRCDQPATESAHGTAQEARMLLFFGEP